MNPQETAAQFNQSHEWDCNKAYELACAVLTDANWHSLARILKQEHDKQHQEDVALLESLGVNWQEGEEAG